ncbi:NAD(P)-dependent dehydrogenase (short-subunit alcohol dehydrogenase family) [Labedella gwakjiensis]|uniref:NAD(P)-dependent dehydrogenase (Short-subunit alcohol dehydrogenase family) n=1 Tax=Labedella gwakjiensis TaxID=390269 RepID=A0A2P8GX69_9MICO|nr:SDR family oxidoreductase [Labedella gwakjiensis]PSL38557.1 NAD(P)-dependent dehydrogenase (short-subunit alcohol dehydrogenase family) [Labedella gwakjiensis]RUQ86936.1 SDR family oxidoreductase [Labedella gwakjiensis]
MSHLTDPTKAFPQPPFPEQKQPVPGDFYKMDPAPDHGEKTYEGHGRLAGRRALITGGDSGIGRAVAIAFAREGADVAIGYLPEEQENAEDTAKLVEEAGRTVALLPGDIAKEEVCQQLVADTVSKLGGIDLLVMVAGIMPTVDSIDDLDTGVLDHVMKTNVYSLFWLTKAASPHLEPGSGIITTGSIQSFQPSPSLAEYATSKAGITNWTRAMAGQLAERGIRVNGVAPGPFWTPLQPSSVPMEKLTSFGEDTPFGRPGQPAELASTYVYLASNESSYTSGETIVVNGGTTGH